MTLENHSRRKTKIELITGLANGTRTIDDAFYMQSEINKEGFILLSEIEKKQFKALWKKHKVGGLESLTNDEKLFMVRCYRKSRGNE